MEGELHSTNDETSSNEEQNLLGKRNPKTVKSHFIINKRQKTEGVSNQDDTIKINSTTENTDES